MEVMAAEEGFCHPVRTILCLRSVRPTESNCYVRSCGEVLLFGISWAHLEQLKRRGTHVGGPVGLGMAAMERG